MTTDVTISKSDALAMLRVTDALMLQLLLAEPAARIGWQMALDAAVTKLERDGSPESCQ